MSQPAHQLKRTSGKLENYDSKILINFLKELSHNLSDQLDFDLVEQKVRSGMSSIMPTENFTKYLAETLAYLNIQHPDYSYLSARVIVHNLHKKTHDSLLDYAKNIMNYEDNTRRNCSLLGEETFKVFEKHHEDLQKIIKYERDFQYDIFGFKTLEKSYLLRKHQKVVERPQQLIMRVSVGIHGDNLEKVKQTYDLMSQKYFTHATPTLFNSGTPRPQMSSCFLLDMTDDSITGIYETLTRCALISKSAGGIGVSVSRIRAKGSHIRGTNGISNGLVPMLRVYDSTARYVDQGGGKRKGSFAMYIEPWHADIFEFLDLRKNSGKEELRARDLFYGLWIPDLFMERVDRDENWTLMCPAECPGLNEVYGIKFEKLYKKYEQEGRGRKSIPARKVWKAIVTSQIETGTPYMLYKDACNEKSNQKNLGTIKSSNLCTEIIEYTDKDEVAVCNLASIALSMFVTPDKKFDFQKLIQVTKVATENLNIIIDKNFYPIKEAENSNFRHRPIGLGVQGLANCFAMMELDYDSKEALKLNNQIFETIYYAACQQSMELAKQFGPYKTFLGSPASEGILQFDLWGKKASMYDWTTLKKQIKLNGMRNSLLVAPMPTASTSQILGNNETFEAFTTNIYSRRVLSGEFICVNRHLIQEMLKLGLWKKDLINEVLANSGSIQKIEGIPENIKKRFRTVWEMSQKAIIDLAIGRAPFIDQSQSLNIFLSKPDYQNITSMHFYGWRNGLKTGMYYLRSRPAVDAIKFTVDMTKIKTQNKQNGDVLKKKNFEENEVQVCKLRPSGLDDEDDCLVCGSQ